ncbi:MAG: pitrilysin family protein [Thermoanaerobaculia bacterium]
MAEAASPIAVRVRHVGGAPIVAIRILFAGGSRAESIPGQALLAGRALAEGTLRRDHRRLADEAEARGMILASFGGLEYHGVGVDALADQWEEALERALELVFEPSFPEDRLRVLARQAAAELEAQEDQADLATARAFSAQLYGEHAKGRPLQGSAASLARITREDCLGFHRARLAGYGVAAIAGPIPESAVAARLRALLPPPIERLPAVAPVALPLDPAPRREIVTRARDQAHLFLGQLTVDRAHPDFPALEVLSVILGAGSGLTGRIPLRVRERDGLAYTASAEAVAGAGLDPGRLVAYVGTAPANLERVEAAMRDELDRLLAEGTSEEEVAEAKAFLAGREPFRRETARQWADLMANAELYGLPLDDPAASLAEIRDVERAAVDEAARRHLDAGRLVVTIGRPRGVADGGGDPEADEGGAEFAEEP